MLEGIDSRSRGRNYGEDTMKALLVLIYRTLAQVVTLFVGAVTRNLSLKLLISRHGVQGKSVWFHAASAGELEVLMPVLELCMRNGTAVWVTLFSPSNKTLIDKLNARFMKEHPSLWLGASLSPLEGFWKRHLARLHPKVFVTAKYEAWPELWMSLAELDIPLWIVGAKVRSSLKIAQSVCSILLDKMPKLVLGAFTDQEKVELQRQFRKWNGTSTSFLQTTDPRWDRISDRASKNSSMLQPLLQKLEGSNRPWGCLAQVWMSDLPIIASAIKNYVGTLLVVPHSLEESNLRNMTKWIEDESGKKVIRSSHIAALPQSENTIWMIDQFGILLELYRSMDWAYVGGGFEKGIHNTMEPAYFLLPIAYGPKNHENFSEIPLLSQQGQLTLVQTEHEFQDWLSKKTLGIPQEMKLNWENCIRKQMGGSKVIFEGLIQ